MRVALVCPYAWDRPGGVQTHVRYLARALRDRGHEAFVVAPRWHPEYMSDGALLEPGVALVGRAHGVPFNGSVAPLALGPTAVGGVRRALRAVEPDVIHVHEPFVPSLSLPTVVSPLAPLVGTFHMSADLKPWYSRMSGVAKRIARNITIRTAVSDSARETASTYLPGDYTLTPNGIDAERFRGAAPADLGLGKKVLFLNRLEHRKGLDVLVTAMGELRDLDVRLIVAGTGALEGRARSLCEDLGVPVTFLGRVHDDEVPSLYRAADVYCSPARFGESFGITLVEAMAAGTPLVCSDIPGFRAVAGNAAAFVPPDQPVALATALREVLSDDARAREMTRRGLVFAGAYDWRRLVRNVEDVYERALIEAKAAA